MDLKALDAYSVESVEKGLLYEVYNHYLHYSVFVSASTRTTVVPATVFLQTWNGSENETPEQGECFADMQVPEDP